MPEEKNEAQKKETKMNPEEKKLKKLFHDLQARDFRTKNDAIKALGRMRSDKATEILYEIAESPQWKSNLRVSALDSLGRKKKQKKFQGILEKMASAPNQKRELKRAALTQLSKFRDPKTINIFKQAMEDDYRFIRFWAVRGLIKIHDRKTYPILIHALGDPDQEIRKEVRAHLEMFGNELLPELIKAFNEKDALDYLKYGVLGLIGRIKHPNAFKTLLSALEDENHRVVTIALRGLSRMKNAEAMPALMELYKNREEMRKHIKLIISRLGRAQPKLTILYLVSLLTDDDEEMKKLAIQFFQRLGDSYQYLTELAEDKEVKKEIRDAIKGVIKKL